MPKYVTVDSSVTLTDTPKKKSLYLM
jgi:hypothetical protein